MSEARKYLIVGPSWVGDMVMAQSLFIDIKQREPDSRINVLAPAWTAALIDRMPQVDELVAGNFDHGKLRLGDRIRLGKSLRDKHYTNAILLPNSLKSALVPAVARIPVRTGWLGEQRWGLLNDIRRLDKQAVPMTVQRFVALGRSNDAPTPTLDDIPVPLLKVEANQVDAVLGKNGLSTDKRVLVLCPGAEFGASKQWPAAYYAEVAKHYTFNGWQVWLMGSENDIGACQEISSVVERDCHVLAGKTSLPEAVDLISLASLVVSNDSGLMHIGAALQKPLIAIMDRPIPVIRRL